MNVKLYIGEQIKKRRQVADITQEELADYLGLNRTSIINIEKGRQGTTAETLWLICNAVKCTPNDLFPCGKEVKRKFVWVEKMVKVKKKVRVERLER